MGADDVVLEADAARVAQSGEPLRHEEGRLRLARERAVEEQVDEVAAGLDGEHHPRLHLARRAQLAQAGPCRARGRAGQVPSRGRAASVSGVATVWQGPAA